MGWLHIYSLTCKLICRFFEFLICKISSSENGLCPYSKFCNFLSCINVLTGASSTILRITISRHPCLVSHLKEKALSVSSFIMIFCYSFFFQLLRFKKITFL